MGLIVLFTSFDPTGVTASIVGGKSNFQGFDTRWYILMGKTLCTALLLSSVATNLEEVKNYLGAF